MSRRRVVSKRMVAPDLRYNEVAIMKFINSLMYQGKKSVAERIFYGSLEIVGEKSKGDSLKIFKQAMHNVMPVLEVKSRRVGGATYQVPVEVSQMRRQALAIRWIIKYSRDRAGKNMQEKLAAEILDAANNKGSAIKKKEDTHKMAEANKAFAHYRW
ncbi:MAG: 30S ribosomal protein S7 [bacterium]